MASGKIDGLTVDQLVSGTKVDVTVSVAIDLRPNWTGSSSDWTHKSVKSVALKIGATPIVLPVPPSNTDSYLKSVRFASTHFADSTEIEIDWSAEVQFQRIVNGVALETETGIVARKF
jgi:hypothetical protein